MHYNVSEKALPTVISTEEKLKRFTNFAQLAMWYWDMAMKEKKDLERQNIHVRMPKRQTGEVFRMQK